MLLRRHRFPPHLPLTYSLMRTLVTEAVPSHGPESWPAGFKPQAGEDLLKSHRLIRTATSHGISHVAGHRSYVLMGDAARLERALLMWTMRQLVKHHSFTPVIVPNLVYDDIVQACGFDPHGERTQVYSIRGRFGNASSMMFDKLPVDDHQVKGGSLMQSDDASARESGSATAGGAVTGRSICLSGTSEIPLVSLHIGKTFDVDSTYREDHLPKRYCALSRCYRAETGNLDKGLYRVHYFNKVEMVALTRSGDSDQMMRSFVEIQESLFSQLGLTYRKVDIPADDLGPAAKTKIDIEAFFPSRGSYGEISSASDCSDNQCSKLGIRYRRLATQQELHDLPESEQEPFITSFAHSVNGTAAATPRLLLPILESHQLPDGRIAVPRVLQDYMDGQAFIRPLNR